MAVGHLTVTRSWRLSAADVARVAIVAGGYFGVAKLGLLVAFANSSVTAVWPPSGLALAAAVIWGWRIWPGIALGAFLANLTTQGSVLAVCGISLGNTLEPLVGAYLLSRIDFRRSLERIRDVLALVVLAGAISTLLSATIGIASLAADGHIHHGMLFTNWRTWWLGDFGGVVLVGSAILVLTSPIRLPVRRLWVTEAAALVAAMAGASALVFSGGALGAYATLPLLFWTALRFGQPGAVCGGLIVAAFADAFAANGQGPFIVHSPDSSLLNAQAFVCIAVASALLVAALRSEQRGAEEAEEELRIALRAQQRQDDVLREAQERFRGAFEHAPIGMALVATDGRWVRVNRALCDIVGYSERELLERRFQDITHPDDLETDLEQLRRMLSGEISSYQLDKRYIHRDGRIVWITLSVSVVHDADGEPVYFVSQMEDITERKRSQLAVEATLEVARAVEGETELDRVLELIADRSRALVEASGLAILLADGEQFVVAAAVGSVDRSLIGRRVDVRRSLAGRVVATGQAQSLDPLASPAGFALGALGVSALSVLAVPLRYRGEILGVLEALDRIGGPRFVEDDERLLLAGAASAASAIATAQSVGRERVRRTLRAAEDERRRWARELHDETLQALAGLRVLLSSAGRSDDVGALRRAATAALEQLDTEIEGLRVLISELRPAVLDELGLKAALEALAERTRVRYSIEVTTAIDATLTDRALDPELETVVFRVAQEALTNAVRHADPAEIDIRLERRDGLVRASITDDGDGFDIAQATEGLGLLGMRERVSLVGGRFELRSSARGTDVTIVLPTSAPFAPAPLGL